MTRKVLILGAVAALVVIVWSAAWIWASGLAGGYVKGLADADGVTTPKVVCGSFGIGGFPFGFDMTCAKATITMADTTVTVNGLKASAEVYNPTHILLFAQSPIAIADAFTGSQSRIDFDSAEASARLDGWRIGRISLIVEKPVWNDTVMDDRLIAKADHLEAHLLDIPAQHDAAAGLASLAQYAEIDALDAPGFQVTSGKTTFQGEISKLPDDVRTYSDPTLLRRWQAAGGQFTLSDFKGDDGDTHFDATGNLGLDDQGRLQGQLTLNSKGLVERFGSAIPNQYKGLIVGGQAADGSYTQNVRIAAGLVFAGLVPAAMIPPLY